MKQIEKQEPKLTVPVNALDTFDADLKALTTAFDGEDAAAPPKPPREVAEFVNIANQAAAAMVQAAENAVTEAQSVLEGAKARADKIRAEISKTETEIATVTARTRLLGQRQLDASREFLGEGQ